MTTSGLDDQPTTEAAAETPMKLVLEQMRRLQEFFMKQMRRESTGDGQLYDVVEKSKTVPINKDCSATLTISLERGTKEFRVRIESFSKELCILLYSPEDTLSSIYLNLAPLPQKLQESIALKLHKVLVEVVEPKFLEIISRDPSDTDTENLSPELLASIAILDNALGE